MSTATERSPKARQMTERDGAKLFRKLLAERNPSERVRQAAGLTVSQQGRKSRRWRAA